MKEPGITEKILNSDKDIFSVLTKLFDTMVAYHNLKRVSEYIPYYYDQEILKLPPKQNTFMFIFQWLRWAESRGLAKAIDDETLDLVLEKIEEELLTGEIAQTVREARNRQRVYQENYPSLTDHVPNTDYIEFFLRDEIYLKCQQKFELNKSNLASDLYKYVQKYKHEFPE